MMAFYNYFLLMTTQSKVFWQKRGDENTTEMIMMVMMTMMMMMGMLCIIHLYL